MANAIPRIGLMIGCAGWLAGCVASSEPVRPTLAAGEYSPNPAYYEVATMKKLFEVLLPMQPQKTWREFKKLPEDKAIFSNYRTGLGLFLRNNFLWPFKSGESRSKLGRCLAENGTEGAEGDSILLLKVFWRHLNSLPLGDEPAIAKCGGFAHA